MKHIILFLILSQPVSAANQYVRCSLPEPPAQCIAMGGEPVAYRLQNGTALNFNWSNDFQDQAWNITEFESDFKGLPIKITHTFDLNLPGAKNIPVSFRDIDPAMKTTIVSSPTTRKISSASIAIRDDFFDIWKDPKQFRNFTQHEAGHVKGLQHTQRSNSSMSSGGNSITDGMDFDMRNGLMEIYEVDNGSSITVEIPGKKFNLGIHNIDDDYIRVYKVSGYPKQHQVTIRNLPAGRYRIYAEPVTVKNTAADFDNGENLDTRYWLCKTEIGVELCKHKRSTLRLGSNSTKRIKIR